MSFIADLGVASVETKGQFYSNVNRDGLTMKLTAPDSQKRFSTSIESESVDWTEADIHQN